MGFFKEIPYIASCQYGINYFIIKTRHARPEITQLDLAIMTIYGVASYTALCMTALVTACMCISKIIYPWPVPHEPCYYSYVYYQMLSEQLRNLLW